MIANLPKHQAPLNQSSKSICLVLHLNNKKWNVICFHFSFMSLILLFFISVTLLGVPGPCCWKCMYKYLCLALPNPLQFADSKWFGVDEAVLYMLHWVHLNLNVQGEYPNIMFLDFWSAFNTVCLPLLQYKLEDMGCDADIKAWIKDYLTGWPQFLRLGDFMSETIRSKNGAPQGTVLAPLLFKLYPADFQ